MGSWTRRLVAAAALLAVAGIVWAVFRPVPLRVDLAAVDRGPVVVTVDEEGETRVKQRYVVAAPTTGRLLRIGLEAGDVVEAGALLARIEPVPLDPRDRAGAVARLEAAEANRSATEARTRLARASFEQARRNARRADRLREAGTLSTEAHEQVQLELTRAQQDHQAAQFAADAAVHEVEAARAALIAASGVPRSARDDGSCAPGDETPCSEVRAPVAGRVLRIHEKSERIVTAGTPLLDLGDPTDLEIVVDVLSTDAVRMRPGARVMIDAWGGEVPLEARLERIEPSAFTKVSALGVEEQRVNAIVALAEPVPGLGDGFRVEARVVVAEVEDALRLPASALFRAGGSWAVFVVEGGRARRRGVEIGALGGGVAAVEGGLDAGASVILHPSDQLADGARVEPF